jgi:hypothetical protein
MLPKATDPAVQAIDDRQEPTRNPGQRPVAGEARDCPSVFDNAGCGVSPGHRVSRHGEDRVHLSNPTGYTAYQRSDESALSQPLRAADRSSVFPEVGFLEDHCIYYRYLGVKQGCESRRQKNSTCSRPRFREI